MDRVSINRELARLYELRKRGKKVDGLIRRLEKALLEVRDEDSSRKSG